MKIFNKKASCMEWKYMVLLRLTIHKNYMLSNLKCENEPVYV